MQERPTHSRQAISVSDYFDNAYNHGFTASVHENIARLGGDPLWEDTALLAMLRELAEARRWRLEQIGRQFAAEKQKKPA